MTRQEYIAAVRGAAILACQGTDLFPSLMIAQAAVESGNGGSELALEALNHFGIKADASWHGKTMTLMTHEVVMGKTVTIPAKFRAYDTLNEGFKDRNDFLYAQPRYHKAGVFTAATPEAQAQAFQDAGYATDPNYAKLLISVLHDDNLKPYDE